MNKTRIALAVLLAAGALGALAPWYTGTQLEEALQHSIRQGNEQLQDSLYGMNVGLELVSLDRGFFSSTAHYRIRASESAPAARPVELLFSDRIEHGPFPWSRLKALELKPVMAASHFELERSDSVQPLFAGAGAGVPLSGSLTLGYDDSVTGRVTLHPLEYANGGQAMRFSGMTLELVLGAQAQSIRLDGGMDSLSLDVVRDDETLQLRLEGLAVHSDHRLGKSGLYLGGNRVTLARAELTAAGRPPLRMSNFVETDRLEEQGGHVSGTAGYDIGMLSYDGKDLGSLSLALSLGNLDATALKSLGEWYRDFLRRLQTQPDGDTGLSEEERSRLQDSLGSLLAGRPSLALDHLAFKTASGESRFSLKVDLARPDAYELPPAELARQTIGKVDARLALAKPMIRDLASYQASLDPGVDQASVALQAAQTADMVGEMATAMQFARVEGDNIVATLSYADGQVDFNGQKMPVEQFAGLLLSRAPAGAMGMAGAAVEESGAGAGEGEEDLGEPVESAVDTDTAGE